MRDISRLESFSKKIAADFENADALRRKDAAYKACLLAIELAEVESDEIAIAVELLQTGIGDRVTIINKVSLLANKYDDMYLSTIDSTDTETIHNSINWFSKARALSSLSIYLTDAPDLLDEVIYEAISSTKDSERIIKLINDNLF